MAQVYMAKTIKIKKHGVLSYPKLEARVIACIWLEFILYLACPARFERATYALEGRCSIQLSYGQSLIRV